MICEKVSVVTLWNAVTRVSVLTTTTLVTKGSVTTVKVVGVSEIRVCVESVCENEIVVVSRFSTTVVASEDEPEITTTVDVPK